MVKVPPRPNKPSARVSDLMTQVTRHRKFFGFSREKVHKMLNLYFLHPENWICEKNAGLAQWERGEVIPSGETCLALQAFLKWSKAYHTKFPPQNVAKYPEFKPYVPAAYIRPKFVWPKRERDEEWWGPHPHTIPKHAFMDQ